MSMHVLHATFTNFQKLHNISHRNRCCTLHLQPNTLIIAVQLPDIQENVFLKCIDITLQKTTFDAFAIRATKATLFTNSIM